MVLKQGYELVIGAKKDLTFGSVIVFGTGGELLEAIEDYSIGLPPLNQVLARRMMEETKIFRYLQKNTKLRKYPEISRRDTRQVFSSDNPFPSY